MSLHNLKPNIKKKTLTPRPIKLASVYSLQSTPVTSPRHSPTPSPASSRPGSATSRSTQKTLHEVIQQLFNIELIADKTNVDKNVDSIINQIKNKITIDIIKQLLTDLDLTTIADADADATVIIDYITAINSSTKTNGGKCRKKQQRGGARITEANIAKLIHVTFPLLVIFTCIILYVNNVVDPFVCKRIKYRVFGFFYNRTQIEYCRIFNVLCKRYTKFLDKVELLATSSSAEDGVANVTAVFTELSLLLLSSYGFIQSYKFGVNRVAGVTAQIITNPISYVADGMSNYFKKAVPRTTSTDETDDPETLTGAANEEDLKQDEPDGENAVDPDEDDEDIVGVDDEDDIPAPVSAGTRSKSKGGGTKRKTPAPKKKAAPVKKTTTTKKAYKTKSS